MEKMTQKDFFNEIITLATENGREDIVEFCNGRIVQLNKKSASGSKRKSKITDERKQIVLDVLTKITEGSVGDIISNTDEFGNSQQCTPVVRALVEEGLILPTTKKGKTVYSLAE